MVVKIIESNEVKFREDQKAYIQMNFRREIKEIHLDIKRIYWKHFYDKFSDRIDMLDKVFNPIFDMSPSERSCRIDNLPNIPSFLNGNNHFNLQIEKEQSQRLNDTARLLNTTIDNWGRLVYYLSLPDFLYAEYPYLAIHYKFIEDYLNYYMQVLDCDYRFNYYEEIVKNIDIWK